MKEAGSTPASSPMIWAEVNLDAMKHNLGQVRDKVGNAKILAAVKADAYGHGTMEVSRVLQESGVDMLGVARIHEAMELRSAGIDTPILVFGPVLPDDITPAVATGARLTLCDMDSAMRLSDYATPNNTQIKCHIKIDTGMGRLGVREEEAVDFVCKVATLKGIIIEGIYTHFPSSDEEDKTFTLEQIRRFVDIRNELRASGIDVSICHTANSSAILEVGSSYMDMVRPGLMLYGLHSSEEARRASNLQPAMALKSRILFCKEVPAGKTISYGRTFATKRPTRVAAISAGYGDGYSRLLSNCGHVLVAGRRIPILGRVCMDITLIDVTDVPDARVGSVVVLYGRQGHEHITVEEIAELIGTIAYEVVCTVGKRVPRIYLRE